MERERAICDYEGTSYRARFWDGKGRDYEDLAERIAVRHLLPPKGRRIVELGAGFGRLADLYDGYEQVILLDYAKSGLREAQQRLGRSDRFVYVAADIYHLPLAPGVCDAAVTVRVLHHLVDVAAALRGIAEALQPDSTYILEYANKRNIKAMLRYLLHKQAWSPYAPEPYEFASLNFDFHPRWMADQLHQAGFHVTAGRAVSHFRQGIFKRLVPAPVLARLDGSIQQISAGWKWAPSVFLQTRRTGGGPTTTGSPFRCPICRALELERNDAALVCTQCEAVWTIDDGIYDFKNPAG